MNNTNIREDKSNSFILFIFKKIYRNSRNKHAICNSNYYTPEWSAPDPTRQLVSSSPLRRRRGKLVCDAGRQVFVGRHCPLLHLAHVDDVALSDVRIPRNDVHRPLLAGEALDDRVDVEDLLRGA